MSDQEREPTEGNREASAPLVVAVKDDDTSRTRAGRLEYAIPFREAWERR